MVGHTRRNVLTAVGTGLAMSVSAGVTGADEHAGSGESNEGVRVVHLSPDAPPVDVYIDDELAFENVEPFATRSDYLPYEPGTYTVRFTPVGGSLDEAVLETDVTLESGEYTLAAIGEVCAVSGNPLQIATLEDDNSPTGEGNARVRGVHASPDAPAVDVTVNDGEMTLFEGLEFGDAEYAEIPAGEGVVEVRKAGRDEILARFAIDAEAGHVYTAFGVGYLNPDDAPDGAEDLSFSLAITEDAAPGER